MPFVRIYLRKGTPIAFRRQISQSVHQSLITRFKIPEDDLFQVIEEVDLENIIFPKQYMGIPHTEDIIYIQITAKAGRTKAMKQALYRSIADEFHRRTQRNPDDLIITLIENIEEDWSFGRGEAQLVNSPID